MRTPIQVRPLTEVECKQLEAGLRSSDSFVLRRSQILLASARGRRAPQIAANLGCNAQTVRNGIWAFNKGGLSCLAKGSTRPHRTRAAFSAQAAERLRDLLHHSPRSLDKLTSLWTLKMAAEVSFEQGLTAQRVSGETIRATLARFGVRWRRAKKWINSPDPAYGRKKRLATDSSG